MGRGPDDADIDPAHVTEVLRGLYHETALAGSRNSLLPTLEVTTSDHILFGTDWPTAPEPTVVRNIGDHRADGDPSVTVGLPGHLQGRPPRPVSVDQDS
jgi:hypothetical protein